MQYAFSFVMRGEQKMEGERFSFEMPHFTVMADETPKTCIEIKHNSAPNCTQTLPGIRKRFSQGFLGDSKDSDENPEILKQIL